MALNVDYRPDDFEQFVGNETLVETLKAVLKRDNPKQSYLISGPSGCGKTTLAGIIKKELGCSDYDYFYFNASNTRGIDTVREVLDNIGMSPMKGPVKVYVFDECHQMTRPAQEALLKDIENPPPHVFFVLCTTEPEKLQVTLKRRVTELKVEKLVRKDIIALIREVLEAEEYSTEDEDYKKSIQAFPNKLISQIATASEGSPGQALKLLDQVINMQDQEKACGNLQRLFGDERSVIDIGRALVNTGTPFEKRWERIRDTLKSLEQEPEVIRKGILTYLQKVIEESPAREDLMEMISYLKESTFYSYKAGLYLQCYQACLAGTTNE